MVHSLQPRCTNVAFGDSLPCRPLVRPRFVADASAAERVLAVVGSPDELRGISIAKATALANERLCIQPRQSEADARLRRWLLAVTKTAKQRLGDVDSLRSRDTLLPLVEELAVLFAHLHSCCRAAPKLPK